MNLEREKLRLSRVRLAAVVVHRRGFVVRRRGLVGAVGSHRVVGVGGMDPDRREVHLAPAPRGGIVEEHHRGFLLGAHLPMELGEALLVASARVRVTLTRSREGRVGVGCRVREGEAHARPARPREQVQGGEDLLIEPVVRVELGSPPTDHVHAFLRRPVQPVVVPLVLVVADRFLPLPAFALLLGGASDRFVSVVFSFSAHPVLGLAAVGRPVTRCRALDRRRIDGDGRHRERCKLGAIAHRQRSLERARHRRRDDAQQRKKAERTYASQSAAGQPGVKTEVFHPTESGGVGCWPTGGCPPPGAPPTRDRRENPTEREVIDLNPRTAPRRPERDPPDVSHGGSKLGASRPDGHSDFPRAK